MRNHWQQEQPDKPERPERPAGGHGIARKLACLLATFVLFAVGYLFVSRQLSNGAVITASSALTDVLEIDELSTAEFIYNGIAEVYEEKNPEKIRFYVCYNSTVKVGINLEQVKLQEINEQKKTVRISIPAIEIMGEPVIDHNRLSCMTPGVFSSFSPNDYDFKVAYEACLKDAEKEAASSRELFETAEENLKTTLQALLDPVVGDGYTYVWETTGKAETSGKAAGAAAGRRD